MKRYCFIINPLASSGRAAVVWRDCKNYLDKNHIEYETYMSTYAGHASKIAEELTAQTADDGREPVIIVIGGDGTLGDVIDGIHVSSSVALAYIPGGSGNDFARAMHLKKKPVKCLKSILKEENTEWIDYGVLSWLDGKMNQRRFIVSSGMGLDARICEGVSVSPLKTILNKLHIGKLTYVGIGIQKIITQKPFTATIRLDGTEEEVIKNVRYISIHLQPYEGGGFKMAPQADCRDGQFQLCIVACRNRLHLVKVLLGALFGKHCHMKGVHLVQCATASFKSDRKVCVHTDGEICGHLEQFHVLCERRKLKFIF